MHFFDECHVKPLKPLLPLFALYEDDPLIHLAVSYTHLTSFNNDGSLNIENSVAIAHHLLDNGSDGLVVCGTTGENPTMSKEDKLALFTAIAKECGHKGTIIANVGTNAVSYTHLMVKGFAKVEYNDKPITSVTQLHPKDDIRVTLADGYVNATVKEAHKDGRITKKL